jgi:hypothetical protein
LKWWRRDWLPSLKTGQRFADPGCITSKVSCWWYRTHRTLPKPPCFRTAIEIAGRQSARIAGLRATTSLARLLDEQSKRDEARIVLAEIYGWFSEGFDTSDLKDAKALLDQLNA